LIDKVNAETRRAKNSAELKWAKQLDVDYAVPKGADIPIVLPKSGMSFSTRYSNL
jgi:hypothetical protein